MIDSRPVCDYEGSNYQTEFWGQGEREYEDRAEQIALKALLPRQGRWFLELGAGAGRQTPLLAAFDHVVLMDYSRTQLGQARARLGESGRTTYVAANVYHLPFAPGVFDGAMMVRVLHHLVDAPAALKEIHGVIAPQGAFILEFANKQNWKAILRYWLHRQSWNPFSPEPVEFAELNFDFHPRAVRQWLADAGFKVEHQRTVSHFRVGFLKRMLPAAALAAADALAQPTGDWLQFSPSVFVRCVTGREWSGEIKEIKEIRELFRCPICKGELQSQPAEMQCVNCGRRWGFKDGIYDFKEELP